MNLPYRGNLKTKTNENLSGTNAPKIPVLVFLKTYRRKPRRKPFHHRVSRIFDPRTFAR
jgi:hypothetical protein